MFKKKITCSFCQKELIPNTIGDYNDGVYIHEQIERKINELTPKVGWYCPVCNKISCSICSHTAAISRRKNFFICVRCGKSVQHNYAK